jgi:hypothetical protein
VRLNLKQGLIYLALAFIAVSIWQDPQSSSDSMGAFLGNAGEFFTNAVDRGAAFVGDLVR